MSYYAELEKLVDAYGRYEWHCGNTPDFTNKRDLALSRKAELMTAIERLIAERDALREGMIRLEVVVRRLRFEQVWWEGRSDKHTAAFATELLKHREDHLRILIDQEIANRAALREQEGKP